MRLAGTGIVVLWPDKRWLGWIFLSAAGLVALIGIVWAVARWHARKEFEREHSSKLPTATSPPIQQQAYAEALSGGIHIPISVGTIQQNAENVKQIQETLAKQSFAQPHIEFTNPEIRPRWISTFNSLVKENPELHLDRENALSVLLARFYYKPEPDVPPAIKVTAQIAIADATGKPIKARYDGTWDELSDSEYRHFTTAQTRSLVVALMPITPDVRGIRTWGFGRIADRFYPDAEALSGEVFILAIELIGKCNNEVVLHQPLKFKLTIDPPDLQHLEDG